MTDKEEKGQQFADGEIVGYKIKAVGELFQVTAPFNQVTLPIISHRGTCRGFSRQSRWRLLKKIAAIHWPSTKLSPFITLTYPTGMGSPDDTAIPQHISDFWRNTEKHFKKNVACLWRIEWKPRLSGREQGSWRPHIHIIPIGIRWYDKDEVNLNWQRAISWHRYVHTWCTRDNQTPEKVAEYMAKYAAKEADSVSLLDVAYHSTGRPWGIRRPELIPWMPSGSTTLPPGPLFEVVCRYAYSLRKDWLIRNRSSFSLLGKDAVKMREFCKRIGLTFAPDDE